MLQVKEQDEEAAKGETDANMETMFGVLRTHRRAQLDALVLNRRSFSQTVENIFSLSFLVKDGRVAITYNEDGTHFVGIRPSYFLFTRSLPFAAVPAVRTCYQLEIYDVVALT